MRTDKHDLKSKRRGPIVLTLIVAAIGILSLGVLTVLGTPGPGAIDTPEQANTRTSGEQSAPETGNTGSRNGTEVNPSGANPNGVASTGDVAVALDVQRIELPDGPAYVLTLGAMAPAGESATLRFNTGQLYDFVVSRDGREVWRWSSGRAFHQAIHERTIDAGTLQTFVEVWDGRNAQGEFVVGDVTVQASLRTNPVVETNSVSLIIDEQR